MVLVLLLFIDAHLTTKILEVAQGMEYIHSEAIVHGDLRGVFQPVKHIILIY